MFRIKYYSLGLKLIVVGLAQIKIKDRLDVGEIARVLAPFAREIKEMNFMKLDYEAIKGEKLLSVKLNKLEYNHLKQIKS